MGVSNRYIALPIAGGGWQIRSCGLGWCWWVWSWGSPEDRGPWAFAEGMEERRREGEVGGAGGVGVGGGGGGLTVVWGGVRSGLFGGGFVDVRIFCVERGLGVVDDCALGIAAVAQW